MIELPRDALQLLVIAQFYANVELLLILVHHESNVSQTMLYVKHDIAPYHSAILCESAENKLLIQSQNPLLGL